MQVVMNAVKIDGGVIKSLEREFLRCIMVFAEEVVQLELARVSLLAHPVFLGGERCEMAVVKRTDVTLALEGGAQAVLLPLKERASAVRTPVPCFAFTPRFVRWRCFVTDFAKHL